MPNNTPFFLLFLSGACVKAEPATLFAALLDFGFLRILAALEATDFEVFSFLAIILHSIPYLFGFKNSTSGQTPFHCNKNKIHL